VPQPPPSVAPLPRPQEPPQVLETLYVRGSRVALRAAPSPESAVLDRLNRGQSVRALGRDGDWWRVRHTLTRQEGFVRRSLLSNDKPPEPQEAAKSADKPVDTDGLRAGAVASSAIIALIIRESVTSYRATRPCACPYNEMRNGRSCGSRSAWSRPGGAKPLCYPGDVTPAMITAYRARQR
jgi:hypothetical protein